MEETVQIPVYRYWRPVYSTEHYLLLNEIAQLWNLYSTRGKRKSRHTLLTTTILQKYCEMNEIQPVYYETRYGLKAVYSREVYEGAYRWFLGQTNNGQENSIKIDGKNYAFTIGLPDSN
jgi:hypothetical protein